MLNDLNDSQRQLADYMSELSEEAFCAGWMEGLELALWDGMNHEIDEFGRLKFTEDIIIELKILSSNANGWIIFDDEREETFVSWKEWNELKKSR